ncbi:ABC transporter ATP-binding protein [Glutamicibacter sp. JC586]|uniref:ABC transporter ATP-binding protein n=1 Tax=Glutamicibacter sp. JC586 TaxID=2590552 RepID=UPI001357060E|nr:ABC transporter ATP-binding protein [Glutamicibacter sp. JC586]
MEPMISLRGLGKTYSGSRRPSVQDVDLEVERGEFLCLLGPSGCGKSTTLRMIAGLEHPTTGEIVVNGTTFDDVPGGKCVPAERRGLGLVFQNYALWPHLNVKDNVGFAPRVQKLAKAERATLVDQALATLSISELADRYPGELSGGQQQRVAIARTLAARPQVMLLDEPLSNLDARLRLEMRAEFQRLHRDTGNTMVFVTHDQFEAMTLATRIVVMDQGRIQQVGSPSEIYDSPANRFVAEFMGSPPMNIIESGHNQSADTWMKSMDSTATSLGIRPEDLHITTTPTPGKFSLSVTVSALLPTGGSWIIELSDGERRYFATSQQRPALAEGQQVQALAQKLHLFDATGERVRNVEAVAA